MNKFFTLVLSLSLIFSVSMSCFSNGTDPSQSYLKAKQQAEIDNLKYVLYFKADWCSPCQWMEETTFLDDHLQSAMNQEFLFVSLDIDAFEGYALKEYFHVYALPTILVFNAQHEIVNRNEGSLSARALLDLVEKEMVTANHAEPSHGMVNTQPLPQAAKIEKAKRTSDLTGATTHDLPDEIKRSVTKYGVQLGAFSSYENARQVQDKAGQFTTEHIEISTVLNGETTIYKVYAGRLDNLDQAKQLQHTLDGYGLKGFAKAILVGSKS
jgi:thiol-disulfide isomerase/thioredoxin